MRRQTQTPRMRDSATIIDHDVRKTREFFKCGTQGRAFTEREITRDIGQRYRNGRTNRFNDTIVFDIDNDNTGKSPDALLYPGTGAGKMGRGNERNIGTADKRYFIYIHYGIGEINAVTKFFLDTFRLFE